MHPRPNPETEEQIRRWTAAGVPQKTQAARLNKPRGYVCRAQSRMHITGHQHGPRVPELDENKVRRLLKRGVSQRVIAEKLHVSASSVRTFQDKAKIPKPDLIPEHLRQQILEEIRQRELFALQIAKKLGVSYKATLRLAHEGLGCAKFVGSRTRPGPFQSYYPQKIDQNLLRPGKAKQKRG
jgi:predicted XRE-type DNA-binding protein